MKAATRVSVEMSSVIALTMLPCASTVFANCEIIRGLKSLPQKVAHGRNELRGWGYPLRRICRSRFLPSSGSDILFVQHLP